MLELGWEEVPNWECTLVHRKQGLCLPVYVDDLKNGWNEAEHESHVEEFEKMRILTNAHHFLTMCIWDALSVNANRTKQSLKSIRRCLGHVFLLEQQKNYQGGRNFTHKRERGPAQKCVERFCELTNKKVVQLYKVSHPCLDDHQLKQDELELVGELSVLTICPEMLVLGTNWTT